MEKSHEQYAGLDATFVDLEKAFDTIDRETLWKIIVCFGYPEGMFRIIVNLHKDNVAHVVMP